MAKDKKAIHETALSDIVDTITNGISPSGITSMGMSILKKITGRRNNTSNFSSIAKATSNLVLTFPVFVEESVPISTARKISKAVERKSMVMVQLLLSAISMQELKDSETVFDLIGKIHSNLNMDDIEEYMQKMETFGSTHEAEEIITKMTPIVLEDNKEIDDYLLSNDIPVALNDMMEVDMNTGKVLGKYIPTHEDSRKSAYSPVSYKDQIVPNDIKKANDLAPSLMAINFYTAGRENLGTAVIGVKAKLQYIKTSEMVTRIITKNKDKNGLFNFIRSTTREISFFKDFLFAVDKAKLDAIGTSTTANPIWKILERRANRSKFNSYFGAANEASAITTLVISSDTAEEMRKEYGFKSSPAEILSLMNAYNLMAFFIADDVRERVYAMYDDGSRSFEVLSYLALEREDNNSYKKIINLLAK